MFVRKDRDGNLVAVGSIDRNRLTQLQGDAKKPKRSSVKAEPKAEAKSEPKADPEPKAEPAEPETPAVKQPEFKSALD